MENILSIKNDYIYLNSSLSEELFAKTKFSLMLNETGYIVSKSTDGTFSDFKPWKFTGTKTINDTAYFSGDGFSGKNAEDIIYSNSPDTDTLLFAVCQAYMNAVSQNISLPCNGPQGILYDKENVQQTLGQVVAEAGKRQLRIAETEKYAHVTFFFSGGRELPFENESRILINSPKVATYDLQPQMSAPEVTEALIERIDKETEDLIVLNFANGDMVGHTGVYDAIRKAVETIDICVDKVVNAAVAHGYTVLITADHGNADNALNPDGSANTAHSLNKVPFIVVDNDVKECHDGRLADIAPTILKLMGIAQPESMTGKSLI